MQITKKRKYLPHPTCSRFSTEEIEPPWQVEHATAVRVGEGEAVGAYAQNDCVRVAYELADGTDAPPAADESYPPTFRGRCR
jgi:hypothetical protein